MCENSKGKGQEGGHVVACISLILDMETPRFIREGFMLCEVPSAL